MNIRREEPRENVCPYFLMKELTPGYLGGVTGTYHTPEGYFVSEEEFEKRIAFYKQLKRRYFTTTALKLTYS